MITDTAIRNAKPQEKPYKLFDGRGLYLLVKPAGKYFRFDYRFQGKRKTLALGVYPDVSLAQARDRLNEARRLIADGVDPGEQRKEAKALEASLTTNNFEAVARDWFEKKHEEWVESHAETVITRLENNVFPMIGSRAVSEITAPELLGVLRVMEARGAKELARRVKHICGQVFRYAIACGLAERDPSADLRGALASPKKKPMATITDPKQVGALLRAISGYQGHLATKCALRFAPLVFVRPGELRHAEWTEFDLDQAEWKIPAEKMKMKRPHIVPLSRQAIAVLRDIAPVTGRGRYVFPSLRTGDRPMSDNTVNAALRRMGYAKEDMTGHGFRGMASTLLHEKNGWRSDVIERQLAHVEKNSVKAAYNYAEYLTERREMMQVWADYLDTLEAGE